MKINCSHQEVVDLDLLIPNPKNPNKHSDQQLNLLSKIMKHQGWRHPIIVSKRSGFIVAGHGRLEAAKRNGWDKAPIDRQDFDSEADEYAFLVSDNKIAELAELDLSMVNLDIADLGPDFDLDLLGIPFFTVDIADKIKQINAGDENSEWAGMPEFEKGDDYIKLIYHFKSESDRQNYVDKNNLTVDFKKSNQWIIYIR